MNRAALTPELINSAKHTCDVECFAMRRDCVRDLAVLDIFCAIIKFLGEIEIARIHMIQYSRGNLAKLSAVELSRLPISLNKSALGRNKFVEQLRAEQVVQRRTEFRKQ